jgi:hypothetical protein
MLHTILLNSMAQLMIMLHNLTQLMIMLCHGTANDYFSWHFTTENCGLFWSSFIILLQNKTFGTVITHHWTLSHVPSAQMAFPFISSKLILMSRLSTNTLPTLLTKLSKVGKNFVFQISLLNEPILFYSSYNRYSTGRRISKPFRSFLNYLQFKKYSQQLCL